MHKTALLVFFVPFLLATFFRYNYLDFPSNAELAPSTMLTAESIARDFDYNVSEFWGAAGATVFQYKDEWYMAHSPLNSIVSAVPLVFTSGIISIFDLRTANNIQAINYFNSFFSGLVQSFALGGIALLLYLFFKNIYQIKNKYVLIGIPIFITCSTFLLNYAVSFSNHIIVGFLLLLSYYFFRQKKYIFSSIFIGIAIWGEYPTAFLAIFYLISFLIEDWSIKRNLRRGFEIVIPLSIFTLLLLGFNTYIFDHPLHFGDAMYNKYNTIVQNKSEFQTNFLPGLYIGLLSPIKGLIWYVPILILAAFNLIKYRKNFNQEFLIVGGFFLFTLILYSSWNNCWGDSPLGPRHIINAIPLLTLALGFPYAINKNENFDIQLKLIFIWGILFFLITMLNVIDGLPRSEFMNCELNKFAYYEKALDVLLNREHKWAPMILYWLY